MSKLLQETNPIVGYRKIIEYLKKTSDSKYLKDDIQLTNEHFQRFPEYVLSVMGTMLESPYDKEFQNEDYKDDIVKKDRDRTEAHNFAIYACAYFNRMCDKASMPRFCPDVPIDEKGNPDFESINRRQIGEFAAYVTMFVFNANAGIPSKEKTDVMLKCLEEE